VNIASNVDCIDLLPTRTYSLRLRVFTTPFTGSVNQPKDDVRLCNSRRPPTESHL